jgi:hypothetical protein
LLDTIHHPGHKINLENIQILEQELDWLNKVKEAINIKTTLEVPVA